MRSRARATALIAAALAGSPVACSLLEKGVLDAATGGEGADAHVDASVRADGEAADTSVVLDDGARPDASEARDARFEASVCDPPEGGPPCDPGYVACSVTEDASSRCAAPAQACCDDNGIVACAAPDAPACTGTFASSIACDETADCAPGEICVGRFDSLSRLRATCVSALPGGGTFQLCRSHAECPLRNCTLETCFTSQMVESCGGTGNVSCMP